MTTLLYYDDAYMHKFAATVTAVDATGGKTRIALNRTAFYPGGGGQPNDEGWLTIGAPYLSCGQGQQRSRSSLAYLGRSG